MNDDKKNRGEPDRSLISLKEKYEVDYWTKKFGVSEAKLREAVKAVGPSVDKVRQYLGK